MTPPSAGRPPGPPATRGRRRRPPTNRRLAERYGVSLRQVERTRRLAATEVGRRLLKHLNPRSAEWLLRVVHEGLVSVDALLKPRATVLRLLRHWRAGQLGALPPPAVGRRPPPPVAPPEPWMFDPRLLSGYCRLAARACPALRIDIRRLQTAVRRALAR